jgi:hypothetical protein
MEIDEEERERFPAMRPPVQGRSVRLRTPSPPKEKETLGEEDLLAKLEARLLKKLGGKLGKNTPTSTPLPKGGKIFPLRRN